METKTNKPRGECLGFMGWGTVKKFNANYWHLTDEELLARCFRDERGVLIVQCDNAWIHVIEPEDVD